MIALILIAALVSVYGLYLLRRFDLRQLHEFDLYAKDFHDAAKPLIEDDETPDQLLHYLGAMNHLLSDRTAARNFLRFVVTGGHMAAPRGPAREVREFFKRRPELEAKYLEAMTAAVFAMSYRSRFWGYKLRLWFSAIETNEKKEEIGASLGQYVCPAAA